MTRSCSRYYENTQEILVLVLMLVLMLMLVLVIVLVIESVIGTLNSLELIFILREEAASFMMVRNRNRDRDR